MLGIERSLVLERETLLSESIRTLRRCGVLCCIGIARSLGWIWHDIWQEL